MKTSPKDVVVSVLRLSNHWLIHRDQLLQVVYLLDRHGADFNFRYTYDNFRPYSSQLQDGWIEAESDGLITFNPESYGPHRIWCNTFRLTEAGNMFVVPKTLGNSDFTNFHNKLRLMSKFSRIVVELAADISYFEKDMELRCCDAIDELCVVKSLKVQNGRLEKAQELLHILKESS